MFGSIAEGRGNGMTADTSDPIIPINNNKLPTRVIAQWWGGRGFDAQVFCLVLVTGTRPLVIGNFPRDFNNATLNAYSL